MLRSYAVVWCEGEGPVYVGKVELGDRHLTLEGSSRPGRLTLHKLFYEDIEGVEIARGARDRIDGRVALVVRQRKGESLRIASVLGFGTLRELEERLTGLTSADARPPVRGAGSPSRR